MDFLSGIVRIMSRKQIGTGFLVSDDGLIVTCAHVLGAAMPEKVTIMFQANGEAREATVIAHWWYAIEAEDVAFLRVDGLLPEKVQVLPLGSSKGANGHPICTFGYPAAGEVEGVRGTGQALGLGVGTKAGQALLQLHSSEITAGFSGAPVWDELRRRVIGMMVIAATPDALGRLGETAFATPTETLQALCPALQPSDKSPYFNLQAFTEHDAPFFFGRERVIDQLVSSLRKERRFLAVFGPSGSGKSSVVRAGLLPRVQEGQIPGSDRWQVRVTHPADSAFKPLLDYLIQATSIQTVVVIDQFEELIVTASDVVRAELVAQLAQLLEDHAHLTFVFVMRDEFYSYFVKNEILAQWTQRGLVNISPTLTYDEVVAIVHKPAAVAGWSFEEGLIETIAEDALATDSSLPSSERVARSTILPLLEFALTQLWEEGRAEGMLTHEAYGKIGGVTGGLTKWADDAFYSFEERLRPLVRHIFTSLVRLGDKDQHIPDTRRSRALNSLARTEAEQVDVSQIVQHLVSARLLVLSLSQDTESKQERVEIIHEALLREWGRLTQWLAEDCSFLVWHQKLEERVQEWVATNLDYPAKRDMYKLFGGRDLIEAEDWLSERKVDLSQQEQAFIEVSGQRQRREVRRLRFFTAALSIFSIIVIILGSLAEIGFMNADQQRVRADQQAGHARAEALQNSSRALAFAASAASARKETDLALLLSSKALQVEETFEARNILLSTLMQSPHLAAILSNGYNYPHQFGPILSLAFGAEGQTFYAYDGFQVFRWIVQTHSYQPIKLPVTDNSGTLGTIAFSPDNRILGMVNVNGIWLVDLQTTTARPPLASQLPDISPPIIPSSAITFSHDSAFVAVSRCYHYPSFPPDQPIPPCAESSVSIWNTQSAQPTSFSFTMKTDIVGLAFSSDGTKLAIASPTDILVADTTTSQQIVSLSMNHAVVTSLAFSPDGAKLAASSEDRTIRLWDATSWELLAPFSGHEGIVFSISFSHDGKVLASTSQDGTIRLWSVGTGNELGTPLTGHREQVFSVAFSPNDKMLVSGGHDGSLMLWDINAEGTINRRLANTSGAHSALFSPDGRTIFTGTDDGKVLLLDSGKGEVQATLGDLSVYALPRSSDGFLTAIVSIALSGDGKILAAGRTDGTIFLWNLRTKKALSVSPLKYPDRLSKVMLSADGRLLAAAGDGMAVTLWDVGKQGQASVFHVKSPPGVGIAMALSSDGRLLAASNCSILDGGNCPQSELLVWEVGTDKVPAHVLLGQWGPFLDVAFSPDGSTLAASGLDGIKLWNMTKQTLITTLTVATSTSELGLYYRTIRFSPDGKQLLSSNEFRKPTFAFALWNVFQKELFVQHFSETASQGSLAFSPDSQRLVSVFTRDRTNFVLLWDIIPSAWQNRGCTIAHRNLTQDEWRQFVKDEPLRSKVCADFSLGS